MIFEQASLKVASLARFMSNDLEFQKLNSARLKLNMVASAVKLLSERYYSGETSYIKGPSSYIDWHHELAFICEGIYWQLFEIYKILVNLKILGKSSGDKEGIRKITLIRNKFIKNSNQDSDLLTYSDFSIGIGNIETGPKYKGGRYLHELPEVEIEQGLFEILHEFIQDLDSLVDNYLRERKKTDS